MKISIKEEEGNVEYESDSEEEMLPWRLRRKKASNSDEEEEEEDDDDDERNHHGRFHCRVSDSDLEGQGGCSDYFTAPDEAEVEEEFLEVGYRVEEGDYCSQDDNFEMELRKRSWYEKVMDAEGTELHSENQVDEKKGEICPVPKSGSFYMHDDRSQVLEGQWRYPSRGQKLWQGKVDQKWEHDRFEDMDSKHTDNRKENKNIKRHCRGHRNRVMDHGCSGESGLEAYAGHQNQHHISGIPRDTIKYKPIAKNNYGTVPTETNRDADEATLNTSSGRVSILQHTSRIGNGIGPLGCKRIATNNTVTVSTQTNQDAGGETLNHSSGKVFIQNSNAKSNLATHRIFGHALGMVPSAPPFYPSRSTCQEIPVTQTKDVCVENTKSSGYHSVMTERNSSSSQSTEEAKLVLRKQSRYQEVLDPECAELHYKNQQDEKDEEMISPVPKSDSFYMHDNRFEGLSRYPSRGQKLWKDKADQKWEHDKFEAIDPKLIRSVKENKKSRSHYRAWNSRVMDDECLGKSMSKASAGHPNQHHTPRTMRRRGPKPFAKNNYGTVPTETNQDAGEVTLNSKSQNISTQNSKAKSGLATHTMSSAAPHAFRMSASAPPFYPSRSTSQDISVTQTRDVWVGNTNSRGSHSIMTERNSLPSHSLELFQQNTSDDTNGQNEHYMVISPVSKNFTNMQFESPVSSPTNTHSRAPQRSSAIAATSVFLPVTQHGGYHSDDGCPAIGNMPPGCLSQTQLGSSDINWMSIPTKPAGAVGSIDSPSPYNAIDHGYPCHPSGQVPLSDFCCHEASTMRPNNMSETPQSSVHVTAEQPTKKNIRLRYSKMNSVSEVPTSYSWVCR